MTFRDFLKLFQGCDHPWGDLARDAAENKAWKGDNSLSLSLLIRDPSVRLVCHDLHVAYLMFEKPTGLNSDSNRQLAHPPPADSSVNREP